MPPTRRHEVLPSHQHKYDTVLASMRDYDWDHHSASVRNFCKLFDNQYPQWNPIYKFVQEEYRFPLSKAIPGLAARHRRPKAPPPVFGSVPPKATKGAKAKDTKTRLSPSKMPRRANGPDWSSQLQTTSASSSASASVSVSASTTSSAHSTSPSSDASTPGLTASPPTLASATSPPRMLSRSPPSSDRDRRCFWQVAEGGQLSPADKLEGGVGESDCGGLGLAAGPGSGVSGTGDESGEEEG